MINMGKNEDTAYVIRDSSLLSMGKGESIRSSPRATMADRMPRNSSRSVPLFPKEYKGRLAREVFTSIPQAYDFQV